MLQHSALPELDYETNAHIFRRGSDRDNDSNAFYDHRGIGAGFGAQ